MSSVAADLSPGGKPNETETGSRQLSNIRGYHSVDSYFCDNQLDENSSAVDTPKTIGLMRRSMSANDVNMLDAGSKRRFNAGISAAIGSGTDIQLDSTNGRSDVEYEDWMTAEGAAHLAVDLATEVADEIKEMATDALKQMLNFSSTMSLSKGAENELRGDSLGFLPPTNHLRILLAKIIRHPTVEFFLLFLIFLNLVSLAATSPGSEFQDLTSDSVLETFNLFCAATFTVEAIVRILVTGFVQGKGTYMRNPWNVFDFVLIIMIWASIALAEILNLDDDAGFALSVLRTLRLMRFFSGIRELMAAVALGYKMLLAIMGAVLYAWVIFGVIGMELFAGAVSSVCLSQTDAHARGLGDLELDKCARMIHCEAPKRCYEARATEEMPLDEAVHQSRNDHVFKIGFDSIGSAFVTEFQITVMDDWPDLAQPIIDSNATTKLLAPYLFALVVIFVSILSVNLFLASMTFSFLTIRQENRGDQATMALFQEMDKDGDGLLNRKEVRDLAERLGHDLSEEELDAAMAEMDDDNSGAVDYQEFKVWYDRSHKNKKSLQDSLGEIIASGTLANTSKEGQYFFPMHKSYTPRCKTVANSKSFELFIDMTVFLNVAVMAMNGLDFEWYKTLKRVTDVLFVAIYTGELILKVCAGGARPYLQSRLNKLDVLIVVTSYVGFFYNENAEAFFAIQLLRVLRIAKLVLRIEKLRVLLELAFSSSTALLSLIMFLMFAISLFGIIGMHLFAKCHDGDPNLQQPASTFGSFGGSVLAIFQIMTNDNMGGIMYYYMDCYGNHAAVGIYFMLVCIFCNYIIVNLFMAVFIENFELSEEIKATKQEEIFKLRASDGSGGMLDGDVDVEPTKLVQLKALQMSLFLDRNTKKHVFQRMSKFSKLTASALRPGVSNLGAMATILSEQLRAVDPEKLTPRVQDLLAQFDHTNELESSSRQKHVELMKQVEREAHIMDSQDFDANADSIVAVEEAADEHALVEDALIAAQRNLVDAADEIEAITGIPLQVNMMSVSGLLNRAKGAALEAKDIVSVANAISMAKNTTGMVMDAKDLAMLAAHDAKGAAREAMEAVNAAKDAAEARARDAMQEAVTLANNAQKMALDVKDAAEARSKQARDAMEHAAREAQVKAVEARDLALHAAQEVRVQAEQAAKAGLAGDLNSLSMQLEGNLSGAKKMALTDIDKLFEVDENSLMTQNKDAAACFTLDEHNLYLFGPESRIRARLQRVLDLEFKMCKVYINFDRVMIGFVFLSSLVLAAEGPIQADPNVIQEPEWVYDLLAGIDYLCFFAFFAECILKMICMGFILTPTAYLLDRWNWLDFSVIIFSIVDLGAKLIDDMHVVLDAIGKITPIIMGFVWGIVMVFTTFGILGVSFFSRRLTLCREDGDFLAASEDVAGLNKEACKSGSYEWANRDFGFDNIIESGKTLFFIWTGDDWGRIVYACLDIPDNDELEGHINAPSFRHSAHFSTYLYFTSFVVIAVFMLKGLFIACVVDVFAQSSGTALATTSQKKWQMLNLILRNIKHVPEPPKQAYLLCIPVVARRFLQKLTQSKPWNHLINISIVVTTAVQLLPLDMWPETASAKFKEVNTAVLLLWTLEFVLKTIAFGFNKYFASARMDCLVIPILWLADALDTIDTLSPELGQHLEFLDFVAAMEVLRVFRLTRLLVRIDRLRSLFATMALSRAQAKNIAIIMFLVMFIWGVVGMKLFGIVCLDSPDNCEVINHRCSFKTINSAMWLLFELATNQDASPVMRDLRRNGISYTWGYFASFYIISNFILLNLFVAAIVENYELGVAADKFDISKKDIDSIQQQWDAAGHSIKLGIHIKDLRYFVEHLTGRFARLGEIDRLWYNRMLIELQSELGTQIDPDTTRIDFDQLVLTLCLIWFGPNCLEYEARQKLLDRVAGGREDFAKSMLRATIRQWKASRNPPLDRSIDPDVWRRATRVALYMMLVIIVKRYKISSIDDVEEAKKNLQEQDVLLQLEEAANGSSLAILKRVFSGDDQNSEQISSSDEAAGFKKVRRWRRSNDAAQLSSDDSSNVYSFDSANRDWSNDGAQVSNRIKLENRPSQLSPIVESPPSGSNVGKDSDLGFSNPIFDSEPRRPNKSASKSFEHDAPSSASGQHSTPARGHHHGMDRGRARRVAHLARNESDDTR